jgi:hypothetical protein
MTIPLKMALVSAVVGLASCANPPMPGLDQTTTSITPVQLISQSRTLQGQRVVVRGYFTSATDTRALWESETAALDARQQRLGSNVDYWAKCITVYPEMASSRFNRRLVVVTGTVAVIEKEDARSLWTCNAVALEDAVIGAE